MIGRFRNPLIFPGLGLRANHTGAGVQISGIGIRGSTASTVAWLDVSHTTVTFVSTRVTLFVAVNTRIKHTVAGATCQFKVTIYNDPLGVTASTDVAWIGKLTMPTAGVYVPLNFTEFYQVDPMFITQGQKYLLFQVLNETAGTLSVATDGPGNSDYAFFQLGYV